ncbi:MAG: metallophosphoesterase family protein [Terriglobales bacterium]
MVKFVHLTDLHVAARNDMWEAEVPAVIEGSPVTPGSQDFKNFNTRLRDFIKWANQEADEGRLDFVFMLGDLVDFCRTGLFDRTPDDSNWSALIEILTDQQGLRVPIFTTTGNHDWRTFPYSPGFRLDLFGITKKCADELDFWYRNTSVEIGKKLEEVQQKLISKGSPLLARSWWGAITSMGLRGATVGLVRLGQRASAAMVKYGRQLMWALLAAWFGVNSVSEAKGLKWSELEQRFLQWFHHPSWPPHFLFWLVVLAGALLISLVAPSRVYAWLRTILEGLIAIEAEVSTISEYFLRVNPYFNYAFQLENCYFIVLDTGPDCLTAQSFWDDGGKKVRRISIGDNILGGSPDTMGFYPANEYYPYSQISWLENVLSCIGKPKEQDAAHPERRRIFVGLHAPPANLSQKKRKQAEQQLELNKAQKKPYVFMEEAPFGGCDMLDGYDIRYGTVNHYLSQFFYLCLGYREREQNKFTGPGVDAVFAGHAHWNMEFQLRRPQDAGPKWSPEVWYGKFSPEVETNCRDNPKARWGPLLLQTAACGPLGAVAEEVPPNFRYVTVDGNGAVCNLHPRTLKPPPEPGVPKEEDT